ncbi:U32 family peptidase [Sandaracinus amylolyticus]|uniref:Peptidase U32 n=1 Tax=Sandaracinus amylolyticus TaxID=927083 RepID=A0A0F6W8K8_9BACT|nr:U32 family peptidase [Sandaracinus amylolyticus]AKF10083.1 Peptidase U32 [Sandaracinus amylolyticus]
MLAPAGDADAMRAAVRAGADAVYFGLTGFNARARATNFDARELESTMRFLHAHGVRGYVTLNTLVFEDELPIVERAIRACAEGGVDAVIVQDLGVAKMVRAIAPSLHLHASTQMTCTDAGSASFAASLGASRIILARELSLTEIAAIRASAPELELEVFVHGALCIAYSGQCLTSEALGGRSANRGACAQACRLPYDLVVDGVVRDLGDRAHLLSPEDLEASSLVPELMKLGITSLKIEGRLKGPDYVGAATTLYRRAISAAMGTQEGDLDETRRDALQAYSRGSGPGFLAGVDHQRLVDARGCDHRGLHVGTLAQVQRERGRVWLVMRDLEAPIARGDGLLIEGARAGEGEVGGRVWDVDGDRVWLGPDVDASAACVGHRVFKTSDPAREKAVLTRLEREPHRIALDLRIAGMLGEAPILEARTERGQTARVTCDAPLAHADKHPLDEARLREQLGRLGDTPFSLRALDVDLPSAAHLPISSLNRARRALTDALSTANHAAHATTSITANDLVRAASVPDRAPPRLGREDAALFVLCRTLEQANAALDAGADGITLDFLELTGTGEAVRALRARGTPFHLTLAPPRIRKPGEEKIEKFLRSLAPDALLVRGLGALLEAQSASDGIERIGDFSLNVTNRVAAGEVLGRGLAAFTPSFDLDAQQLVGLLGSVDSDGRSLAPFAEVVLHHPMPLFHMEHCVIAALLSEGSDYKTCGRPCEKHQISLRDRAGIDHPVEADVGCRNTVFHAKAQSGADLVSRLRERGVQRFRIELVRERASDVHRLVRAYRALIEGRTSAKDTLRELRTEGGYGVVKGTLRVLQ